MPFQHEILELLRSAFRIEPANDEDTAHHGKSAHNSAYVHLDGEADWVEQENSRAAVLDVECHHEHRQEKLA